MATAQPDLETNQLRRGIQALGINALTAFFKRKWPDWTVRPISLTA